MDGGGEVVEDGGGGIDCGGAVDTSPFKLFTLASVMSGRSSMMLSGISAIFRVGTMAGPES